MSPETMGDTASLRRGTIPGGAIYVGKENRNLMAMVRNDYRSAKLTHRVAKRIGGPCRHIG